LLSISFVHRVEQFELLNLRSIITPSGNQCTEMLSKKEGQARLAIATSATRTLDLITGGYESYQGQPLFSERGALSYFISLSYIQKQLTTNIFTRTEIYHLIHINLNLWGLKVIKLFRDVEIFVELSAVNTRELVRGPLLNREYIVYNKRRIS
jgi:hypothetical protein